MVRCRSVWLRSISFELGQDRVECTDVNGFYGACSGPVALLVEQETRRSFVVSLSDRGGVS